MPKVGLAPCPHCGEEHGENHLKCPRTDMPLPLRGRVLDGKFRLISELGKGGMASVWLASNLNVEREVAIKVLRPEITRHPEVVARFRSEARAAGRIGSPHICDILDMGMSPIGPYIVMERLEGYDLSALIATRGPLPTTQAVAVIRHALRGLEAAHQAGIVHRDLKPANIFVHQPAGAEATVKIMDFGVSKFLDGSADALTTSGVLLGTPEYMAPEQLAGAGKIDERADVFSIGAILYRAITGRHVYPGENLRAVLAAMAKEEITGIVELRQDVPEGLAEVIMRCLERDPSQRYPDIEALDLALAPFDGSGVATVLPETKSASVSLSNAEGEAKDEAAQSTPDTEEVPTRIYDGENAATRAQDDESGGSKGLVVALGVVTLALVAWFAFGGTGADEGSGEGVNADQHRAAATSETGSTPSEAEPPANAETSTGDEPELVLEDDDPPPRPPPPPDSTTGDEAGEGDSGGATGSGTPSEPAPSEEPRPAPKGTARGYEHIAIVESASTMTLSEAKAHCVAKGKARVAGITDWKLPNPTVASEFSGNKVIKRGKYWTSANWDGKGRVIALPGGKKSPAPADKRRARPLCVARH